MNPTMNNGMEQKKEVNPLKDLAKAVLTRACLDSLGHITNSSYCGTTEKSILMDTAKRFFDPQKNQKPSFLLIRRSKMNFFGEFA